MFVQKVENEKKRKRRKQARLSNLPNHKRKHKKHMEEEKNLHQINIKDYNVAIQNDIDDGFDGYAYNLDQQDNIHHIKLNY